MCTAVLRSLCAVVLLLGLLPGGALAQEEGQEEGDEESQQLPEIAPREIEIRGELQLSFPSLERQPLKGFTSPATLPSVPDGRTPYAESYKQALDDLPESLPAPSTGSDPVASPNPSEQGFVEIGGGRYASRFAEGRVSVPFTSHQRLSLQADYHGTEGFSPFSGADVNTSADNLAGRAQFESRHDNVTVQAHVHGMADQYTLYGLPVVVQDTAAAAPDRMGSSIGTGVQLRSHGSVEANAELSYDLVQYETQRDPTDASATSTFSEGRLGLDGALAVPVAGTQAHLDLTGSRSTLGGDEPSSSAYSVDGGAALHLLDSNQLSVQAGGRFLGFETPADPSVATSPSVTASFIVPQFRVEATLSPTLTAYANNTPALKGGSLSTLYAENPYAEHVPSLRPTLLTTDAEAGLRLSTGALRLRTTAGYRYAPSYQYFASPTGTGTKDEPFQVGYESARIVHGGAEVVLQGFTGVEASVGVSVRDGTLVGDDDAVPYFSPVVADAMLSVSFADQRGLLQTTGTIESPRPVDQAASAEVPTYVSFDVEGSYEVTPLLDAVLRIQNLSPSAPKRWARYPRPPASITAGFRMHW